MNETLECNSVRRCLRLAAGYLRGMQALGLNPSKTKMLKFFFYHSYMVSTVFYIDYHVSLRKSVPFFFF